MPQPQKLSELISDIDLTIKNKFGGKTFWIKAEITDVKKQPDKRWCFLKFIEKDGNTITTEMKGVFWATSYDYVEEFEEETQQKFASGLEITCLVRVRFHRRFGMDLEVLAIDFAYAIGKLERERKQTLERLVNENPLIKILENGYYSTPNNRAPLPTVFQKIALITAPNSDGQRDFTNVIEKNKYGYAFVISPFLTQVQGDNAALLITEQLKLVDASKIDFDVVVIVRGGGSDIDFKSFNDYELARQVALFRLPILTGIGHDRNTSIVDLMARQLKTPTEVAAFILDNNYGFENNLLRIKERILQLAEDTIDSAKDELKHYKQRVKNLNPTTILKKGFAIVYADNKVVTDPEKITTGAEIKLHLQTEIITSTVTQKEKNKKQYDL